MRILEHHTNKPMGVAKKVLTNQVQQASVPLYFFRDLDHRENEVEKTNFTLYACGIAELVEEPNHPSFSGEDAAVIYYSPFEGRVYREWRAFGHIQLVAVPAEQFADGEEYFELIESALLKANEVRLRLLDQWLGDIL